MGFGVRNLAVVMTLAYPKFEVSKRSKNCVSLRSLPHMTRMNWQRVVPVNVRYLAPYPYESMSKSIPRAKQPIHVAHANTISC